MNAKITKFLKDTIDHKGIKYKFISERANIEYQRLMRIFHHDAVISGSELIYLCKLLEINQTDLMDLIEPAA